MKREPSPRQQEIQDLRELLAPGQTMASTTSKVSNVVFSPPQKRGWYLGLLIAGLALLIFFFAITYLLIVGVGIWGIKIPVAGVLPSLTLSGGSESVTQALSFRQFCIWFTKIGALQ